MSPGTALYLDSNASAPLSPFAVKEIESLLGTGLLANPSSVHSHGRESKRLLSLSKERIAQSLGKRIDPEQIVFTSGGTESNQCAIRSALTARPGKQWVLTPVEHDSVLQLVPWAESQGVRVRYLAVDSGGVPSLTDLEKAVSEPTALVSVVWANNETGVLSPVSDLGNLLSDRKIPLHVDAAQAWGKVPIDCGEIRPTFLTLSGHKIGGLAGSGAMYLGPGTRLSPLIEGKQEKGRRGGTENLLGAVSIGAAASQLQPAGYNDRLRPTQRKLEQRLSETLTDFRINGAEAPRVANTSNVSFGGIDGESLVLSMDLEGYSVSAGSACSSGAIEPSHVLLALGRSRQEASSAIRISFSNPIEDSAVEGFVVTLSKTVARIRAIKTAR